MKKIVKGMLLAFLCVSLLEIADMQPQIIKSSPSTGGSWLSGWTYRKSHVINSATGAGTNYQIKISVHYSSGTDANADVYLAGHCNKDFSDVRFTDDDGSTLLNYWIESKADSDKATFWFKEDDDLSATDQMLYIYYGKSDATTTSYGIGTFLLFDHFDGSSLNTTLWSEKGSGYVSISSSKVAIQNYPDNNYKAIQSVNTYPFPFMLEAYWTEDTASIGQNQRTGLNVRNSLVYDAVTPEYWFGDQKWYMLGNSVGVYDVLTLPSVVGCYLVSSPFNAKGYVNRQDVVDGSCSESVSGYVALEVSHTVSHTAKWDWVLVRKFTDPEPTNSIWGVEENHNSFVSVDPSVILTSPSQCFSVNMRISNVSDLYLWVFSISWNPDVLEFVNITEGEFLARGGTTTGILVKELNQTGGYLKEAACSLMGSVKGVDGSGSLAAITFQANNNTARSSDLNVYFCDLVDSNGSSIPCNTVNGVVYVGEDLSVVSADMPYPGLPKYVTIPINVTIQETGTTGVGAFNVSFTAYWNDGGITEHTEKVQVESLGANTNKTLGFSLTLNHTGNYTLTFTVDCDNEISEFNETNNQLSVPVTVKVQGDVNGDNQVDYKDLFLLAKAYWSTPADPNWNPDADINYDGVVDYKDLYLLARNYS